MDGPLTCQASCEFSWAYASFPQALHPVFIEAVRSNRLDDFRVPDREIRLSRFSINAIGFFGSDIVSLGRALPAAVRPMRKSGCRRRCRQNWTGRARFLATWSLPISASYTQERELLRTNILDGYYGSPAWRSRSTRSLRSTWRERLRQWRRSRRGKVTALYDLASDIISGLMPGSRPCQGRELPPTVSPPEGWRCRRKYRQGRSGRRFRRSACGRLEGPRRGKPVRP